MISYVRTHLDTFENKPVNEIDLAILSWLSYLDLSDFPAINSRHNVCVRDLFCAEFFDHMFSIIRSREESMELFTSCVSSPRFRNVKLDTYMDLLDRETQFSAVTYELTEQLYYVSFRGTDNSFIGWKEDLNLSLDISTKAQNMAARYLDHVCEHFDGEIIVGGHSKGGNLAVYAATACSRKEHIRKIYSFDGPGFSAEDMKSPAFQEIQDRVVKIVPQASLIGMLFENETDIKIVSSRSISLGQHNMLNWNIRDGEFEYMRQLTDGSKMLYRTLNGFMNDLSFDEREKMINTIFDVLEETGVSDFESLINEIQDYIPVIVNNYASLDKETRKFMRGCLKKLAENGVKSIPAALFEELGKNSDDDEE